MSRFKNPHLQPLGTKTVCRKDFFLDHSDSVPQSHCGNQGRLELVNQLNETIEASFQFRSSSFEDGFETGRRKRRKLVHEGESKVVSEGMKPLPALRLISDQQLVSISLESRPPNPPKCYREREYEDDQQSATERRQRAQSIAVDIGWLIRESKVPYQPFPASTAKSWHAIATTLTRPGQDSTPSVAIFERLQPLRRTRPPVPRSEIDRHPYKPGSTSRIRKEMNESMGGSGFGVNGRIPRIEIVRV